MLQRSFTEFHCLSVSFRVIPMQRKIVLNNLKYIDNRSLNTGIFVTKWVLARKYAKNRNA